MGLELDHENIAVIKIGSSTLAHENDLDLEAMRNIVLDVTRLVREDLAKVIMVSSGSVLIGKHRLGPAHKKLRTGNATINQVCSTIGQADLIHAYQDLFNKENVDIAQGLITRRDFSLRDRYNSMRDVLLTLLSVKRVPILNDNDLLTDEEVSFSDNDQLAAYVAAMVNAQRLIILSDVEGLLDKPQRLGGQVVPHVTNPQQAEKFLWGRRKKGQSAGGMQSKINTAKLVAEFGIPMHLVNGKKPGVIQRVMQGEQEGTLFSAAEPSTSSSQVQRWLRAGAVSEGEIRVSTLIADLLRHGRRASVLSVGIDKVIKPFKKDQVVGVIDEEGVLLGRGVARLSSDKLRVNDDEEIEGRTTSPVVIHSDKFASIPAAK